MTLTENINARINKELRNKLYGKAIENECSESSIVRLALKRFLGGKDERV
jgi:hypothetical protein